MGRYFIGVPAQYCAECRTADANGGSNRYADRVCIGSDWASSRYRPRWPGIVVPVLDDIYRSHENP